MAVTMHQVLAQIDKDEPDYEKAAKLGKGALPHLQQIVEADDAMLASKAAYLAGLIGGAGGIEVLDKAAEHRAPIVRVAAADAIRHTGERHARTRREAADRQRRRRPQARARGRPARSGWRR